MFGHEFLEFEFRPDGKLRYANNSHYKNEKIIRKECYVNKAVINEVKRIIEDSEIIQFLSPFLSLPFPSLLPFLPFKSLFQLPLPFLKLLPPPIHPPIFI